MSGRETAKGNTRIPDNRAAGALMAEAQRQVRNRACIGTSVERADRLSWEGGWCGGCEHDDGK